MLTSVLRELLRNLRRHASTTLASLLSLLLLYLILDAFWVAALTAGRFYADLLSKLQMEVFVAESVPDEQLDAMADSLLLIPGVDSLRRVDRNQARAELAGLLGTDLLIGYDSANPLPRSMVITLDTAYLSVAQLEQMERQIGAVGGVEQTAYSRQWLAKAEQTHHLAVTVGMILGGIVLVTALVSSANSFRMMTRLRSEGLHQMRLLGAGQFRLAAPFLLESFLVGVLAAGLGWVGMHYATSRFTFANVQLQFPPLQQQLLYVLAAGLVALASGYLGIRKMLR